jgi:hypothetical protein
MRKKIPKREMSVMDETFQKLKFWERSGYVEIKTDFSGGGLIRYHTRNYKALSTRPPFDKQPTLH